MISIPFGDRKRLICCLSYNLSLMRPRACFRLRDLGTRLMMCSTINEVLDCLEIFLADGIINADFFLYIVADF